MAEATEAKRPRSDASNERTQHRTARRGRKRRALPASTNIKAGLLVASIAIILGTLWYSHQLVEELKSREYRVVRLFSEATKYYANAPEPDDSLYRMIVLFTGSSDVPVILTNQNDVPTVRPFRQWNLNIPYDSTLDSARQVAFLKQRMAEMDMHYQPIPIPYHDPETGQDIVTSYIHFGDSLILGEIETLPYIQLLLGALVVFIGYLSFSYLKRSEQSNIWVGMAKETAHQLGTPLSSLLGWCEVLRLSADDPKQVADVAAEIELDVERLNRIAVRFSKIGSIPDLKVQNVVTVVSGVMGYLEGRLPKRRKIVELSLNTDADDYPVALNKELFEWVMENLIKNAFEAIEAERGSIKVHIHDGLRAGFVVIDVTDTGKGFDFRRRKDVFRPGYSTKERGWGLGLSLSKRIVQEYHHGKLFVKESAPGKGTTFRIRLMTAENI